MTGSRRGERAEYRLGEKIGGAGGGSRVTTGRGGREEVEGRGEGTEWRLGGEWYRGWEEVEGEGKEEWRLGEEGERSRRGESSVPLEDDVGGGRQSRLRD